MSADAESKEPTRPPVPGRSLPDIVELTIRRVPFAPPKYEFVKSIYADCTEAVAFFVKMRGQLRMDQAVTPVLCVADVEISNLESLGENRYRFLAFEDEERRMKPGDPIALGWPGLPQKRRETNFRFEAPPPLTG